MDQRRVRNSAAVVLISCLLIAGCGGDDEDSDAPGCGNGKLDQGERCDVAISPGESGACPTGCSSDDACEPRLLTGTDCDVQCVSDRITACRNADDCCPNDCDSDSDSDCPPAS
jgi:hypothetical protein